MAKKNKPGAGAPKDNQNARKWNSKTATALLDQAHELSRDSKYIFLQQIWKELCVSKSQIEKLVAEYIEVQETYEMIKANCALNCLERTMDRSINNQGLILNLKSNHGMTDRVTTDNTTKIEGFNIKDLLSFDDE